ncbi:porin family protein [Arcicella sp. DC2W]|uniref:Porin family protein n=1 Tax=Arcicella gelida TaxID=2984195 RepID=A0ABU5S3T2_9BACT|nr:porin family protein [Arcicella sp. DC2W]MEA5403152.1 porin family protein [Arcicella sp. DC2W]
MNKKLLLILSLIAFSFASKAQTRFGIKAGGNLANASVSAGGVSFDSKPITSFHVGAVVEAQLADRLYLEPKLLFSQKGFKDVNVLGVISLKSTYSYIELPVNVVYEVVDYLTIGGGPYLGYALGGQSIVTDKSTNKSESQDIEFGEGGMKRLDYGLNFTVGYEVIDGLRISANYSLGLVNIDNGGSSSIKNNVIGISLTKFFGER